MSDATLAGIFLVAVPLAFNAAFALLGVRFDYPDILRRPTAEVLHRFRAGGAGLILLWWAFALTAVLMAPLVVLLSRAIGDANGTLLAIATTVGVLAAVVQFLGLVRWPFLVPFLAAADADPDASPARREAVDVVFQSFNRYLGVGGRRAPRLPVHRRSGRMLAGWALVQTTEVPPWLGIVGIAVGALLVPVLARVRRPHGRPRLVARRAADASRLRRVVALARRDGHRAARVMMRAA